MGGPLCLGVHISGVQIRGFLLPGRVFLGLRGAPENGFAPLLNFSQFSLDYLGKACSKVC